jgi:hypothetical protein
MNPPFTQEQFLDTFAQYNVEVFPIQVALYIAGLTAIAFVFIPMPKSGAAISSILAFLWLWMGMVYHFMYFTSINPAAYAFGIVFSLQALLFLIYGMMRGKLEFGWKRDRYRIAGIMMIIYAMILYPLLSIFLGEKYPGTPTFGLPCPTTIYTFGMLLLCRDKCPFILLVIPAAWAIIGSTAVVYFGIVADAGLIISALIAVPLIFYKNKNLTVRPASVHQD